MVIINNFECGICHKKFKNKRSLSGHLRLATHLKLGTQSPNQPLERQETLQHDPDVTNEVLMFIWDLLDRAPLRFFLLKDIARQIKDSEKRLTPNLTIETIELGITQNNLTETGARSFRGLLKLNHVEPEWTDSYIRFEKKGVPVFIRIIQRQYDFFQNPSKIFYRTEEFEIPNPFENYWIARHIIK